MFNLKKLDTLKKLKEFESENFSYIKNPDLHIDSKDEKVWSYAYKKDNEESEVLFQMISTEKEVVISYASVIYSEELRVKASKMAYALKKEIQRIDKNQIVEFDETIIHDFGKYYEHLNKENIDNLRDEILSIYEESKRKIFGSPKSKNDNRIEIYGEDGNNLIGLLKRLKIIEAIEGEDGTHIIKFKLNAMQESQESKEHFINEVYKMGFSIAQEVTFEGLTNMTWDEVMNIGIFDFE